MQRRTLCAGLSLATLASLGGCPMAGIDGNSGTGNDSFPTATALSLSGDALDFTGELSGDDPVDLYQLGELAVGDRVVIDIQTITGTLDPVAAVFDADENVHVFNDDRVPDATDLNPRLDFVVRGNSGQYVLGVARFPGTRTSGEYRVSLTITRGFGEAEPVPQLVYLHFAGGDDIVVNNVGRFDLQPFDARDVGRPTGQTEAMKDRIQEIVEDRYRRFALTCQNSDDSDRPAGDHSTVYFGGTSVTAFAIAEQIDTFNQDRNDDAIVFTGSFRDAFSSTPTFEQLATALGNTTAHEIGHLLGLVHTAECSSLMDTTCGNDSILIGQAFEHAVLDDSVFPVGMQDAEELIGWAIGFSGL